MVGHRNLIRFSEFRRPVFVVEDGSRVGQGESWPILDETSANAQHIRQCKVERGTRYSRRERKKRNRSTGGLTCCRQT